MLSTTTIVLIAIGLAMDALAIATATSVALRTVSARQVFRLGFHLGLFQALLPIIGWYGGRSLSRVIGGVDHWIAFGLLAFVGGKMIYESFGDETARASRGDPTRGWSLLVLSLATSIDALAVGLSFAVLKVDIWYPVVIIGVVTSLLTVAGMLIGSRLGRHFGQWFEILGGAVLLTIGLKIVFQHVTA